MRLLLDTCTFIWLTQEPDRLSAAATAAINNESAELLLSHASIWELYNKCSAGKLSLPDVPRNWVSEQLVVWGITDLPIDLASLGRMSELPMHHRDPFDRLLIAQGMVHRLTLVSPDPWFRPYSGAIVW